MTAFCDVMYRLGELHNIYSSLTGPAPVQGVERDSSCCSHAATETNISL